MYNISNFIKQNKINMIKKNIDLKKEVPVTHKQNWTNKSVIALPNFEYKLNSKITLQ